MKRLLDKYKTLSSQKEFLKMILANVINRFGDSIDAIAFTWLVYQITQDAAWSAIIFGVNMLPTILLQPLAGPLVECIRKQKIMVLCDIARGLAVTAIAVCYMAGLLNPWLLLLITLLNSSFEALRVPAGIAIVPKLLSREHYDTGQALNSSISRIMELIGTGCAGLIIAALGIQTAILIDAMTFFGSAFIIYLIQYQETVRKSKISMKEYMNTMKEGFSYVFHRRAIVLLCVLGALMNVMAVPINSLFPAFVSEVMKGDSQTLSALSLGLTIGMMIGSFVYPVIAEKLKRRFLMIGALLFSGFVYIIMILLPMVFQPQLALLLSILLFTVFGMIMAFANTSLSVYFMVVVEEDYMARVGSVFNANVTSIMPVSSFLISGIVSFVSVSTVIMAAGIISIIISLVCFTFKCLYELDEDRKAA